MKKKIWIIGVTGILIGFAASGCKNAHDHSKHDHGEAPQGVVASGVCPVSGEALGEMGKPVTVTHDGTEVQLCCKSCIKKFKANPDQYVAKLHKTASGHEDHGEHGH